MSLKIIIGAVIGAVIGYGVMYKLIGCQSGACPITSNPFSATIYGAVLGAALSGIV